MIVWAESPAGASVVKTKTQPANKRLSALGVPLLCLYRHVCQARLACSTCKQ